jgi:hypothetical protein
MFLIFAGVPKVLPEVDLWSHVSCPEVDLSAWNAGFPA